MRLSLSILSHPCFLHSSYQLLILKNPMHPTIRPTTINNGSTAISICVGVESPPVVYSTTLMNPKQSPMESDTVAFAGIP